MSSQKNVIASSNEAFIVVSNDSFVTKNEEDIIDVKFDRAENRAKNLLIKNKSKKINIKNIKTKSTDKNRKNSDDSTPSSYSASHSTLISASDSDLVSTSDTEVTAYSESHSDTDTNTDNEENDNNIPKVFKKKWERNANEVDDKNKNKKRKTVGNTTRNRRSRINSSSSSIKNLKKNNKPAIKSQRREAEMCGLEELYTWNEGEYYGRLSYGDVITVNGRECVIGENGAVAYAHNESCCVDMFFNIVPGISKDNLVDSLTKAWKENASITLKLIFNLGNCRKGGNGKHDKINFYHALIWLWEKHTETFLENVHLIHQHSSLQCLLDVFMFIIHNKSPLGLGLGLEEGYNANVNYNIDKHLKNVEERNARLAKKYESSSMPRFVRMYMRRGVETPKSRERKLKKDKRIELWKEFAGMDETLKLSDILNNIKNTEEDADKNGNKMINYVKEEGKLYLDGTLVNLDDLHAATKNALFPFDNTNTENTNPNNKDNENNAILEKLRVIRSDITGLEPCDDEDMKKNFFFKGKMSQFCKKFDPRVMTQWANDDIKVKYQSFIQARDASFKAEKQCKKYKLRDATNDYVNETKNTNPSIKLLYKSVAEIIAKGLLKEYSAYRKGKGIGGLFAKWCPNPNGMHNKATGVCDDIVLTILNSWPQQIINDLFDLNKLIKNEYLRKDLDLEKFIEIISTTSHTNTKSSDNINNTDSDSKDIFKKICLQVLHRDILTPLRRLAKIPEHFVGTGEYHLVDYDRMPSRCRLLFGDRIFLKHNMENHIEYIKESAQTALEHRTTNKKSIKTGCLLPHEISLKAQGKDPKSLSMCDDFGMDLFSDRNQVKSRMEQNNKKFKVVEDARYIETQLQWWGLVQRCKEAFSAKNKSWLPVCDVSGSMRGLPMEVAIALSLLLTEACPRSNPWFGKMLTFSESPSLVDFTDMCPDYETVFNCELDNLSTLKTKLGDLKSRVRKARGMEWGGSTNLHASFELILNHACECDASEETIRNTNVIIFSDMEFDQACSSDEYGGRYGSPFIYDQISQMFWDAGYESVPNIVFWNLRSSVSVPIGGATQDQVALLSGFSASLLNGLIKLDLTKNEKDKDKNKGENNSTNLKKDTSTSSSDAKSKTKNTNKHGERNLKQLEDEIAQSQSSKKGLNPYDAMLAFIDSNLYNKLKVFEHITKEPAIIEKDIVIETSSLSPSSGDSSVIETEVWVDVQEQSNESQEGSQTDDLVFVS